VTRAGTHANKTHLAPAFFDMVIGRYEGTRLGRQEIDGEVIEERTDTLWTREVIEAARIAQAPRLLRIVVGVDPPASAREGADLCGIVAAGIDDGGIIYVLADDSEGRLSPAQWAAKVVALYRRLEANHVIAEVNMGGDMVRQVIRNVDAQVPVQQVRASRGKVTRAEPVAALYAQGKVRHVGRPLRALEDQMCDFGVGGLSDGGSPDRVDALVWAVTALTIRGWRGPRIRFL
jgi:phage terminase large subunit-like protein